MIKTIFVMVYIAIQVFGAMYGVQYILECCNPIEEMVVGVFYAPAIIITVAIKKINNYIKGVIE